MPHFYAECTDNIRREADLPTLFAKVNEALAATGIFPLAGVRSRAIWLDTWQMAQRYLALSFTMEELDPVLNYKQNNVHALFNKA